MSHDQDLPRRRPAAPRRQDAAYRLREAVKKGRALDAQRTPGHGDRLTIGVLAEDVEWLLAQYTHLPRRNAS